uniref:Hemimethylated DNA-binding domain-containing protein n=1 Tax=Strigamia maritima TaxID=126957 RepID=T1J6H4_STRMM
MLAVRRLTPQAARIVSHIDFNLTEKYYVEKALRFAKHIYLKTKWEEFLNLDAEAQSIESGTILLAQWCQPTIVVRQETVAKQLDDLAWLMINELSEKYKKHPLLELKHLVKTKLMQSVWTPAQCRSILESMNQVLFEQLNYQGNRENFYEADNSYINKVLERGTGNPITMCVLYAAVAQRLGVLCEPVNFPAHFLLRWKEHPTLSGGQEYTYIDVFNRGQFMPEKECVTVLPSTFAFTQAVYEAVPNIRIFQRMAHNLVEIGRQQNNTSDCLLCLRNALELVLLLQPEDTDSRLLLVRVYLHLNINLGEVLSILQHIQATDPTRCGIVAYMFQICRTKLETKRIDKTICQPNESKFRVSDVQFAIGMIMTHKRFNYSCVIYGWDPQCAADNDWVVQMGVNNLSKQRYQPFYHVLVNDGSNRYAAQENLEIASEPSCLTHAEIGRYFSAFNGTYYVPNDEKAKEYPQDEAARAALIQHDYVPS